MTKHLAHHAVASAARPTSARTRVLAATTIGAMALVVSPALPAVAGAAVPATARAGSPHVAMAPHAALALAQPAGKFTPRNCTEASGSASCDLYAMSGSTSILGSSVPIWGFSTTGAVGSATDPGPVLVVQQGDAVTVTLHNQLSEPVSLAFPGQSGITYAGGSGDDMSGAAANGTRTYTFTADRPGTFLYEAGHTTDGTRQVQMGLAGALVVLPPDGTAYGVSSTAYADEAVVVLSEIDPRLNANPAGFDMRDFKPAYRLINGKPFPASDPISTDQGHTVLLRYVNAGSQTHSMSLLGANQVEIAQDGHRSQFTTTVTAESITPGMTLDTLVQMPSGPESKIALYENAQHLDNNGQNNGDPSQVAFGGMLTFLDTNAPPPSGDGVGPVPAHVKASPNPSDGLSDVTVSADLSDATTGGSVVKQAEFVVDDAVAVGVGYGVPMSGDFTSVSVTGAHGTLPATPAGGSCDPVNGVVPVALLCLSAGKHKIYVRALDAAGNWGVVGSVVFNLPKTGPQTVNGTVDSPANGAVDVDLSATGDDSDAGGNITAAEYFVDNAAGANGTGITMTVNRTATVVSEDTTIAAATVAAMTEGTHHLYVHSKDDLGLWGPVLDVPFVVDTTGPTTAAVALGPNPANGVRSDPSNPGYAMISGEVRDETQGSLQSNITNAEAFIDNVRAPGTGLQLLPVDGSLNSPDETVYGLVPLTQIKGLADGTHQVFLRGKDAAGNWGYVQGSAFVVDKAAPVISQLAVAPNPTNGATTVTVTATIGVQATPIQRAEYWYGTTDPGVGKATQVTPSMPTATTAVATVAVPNPTVASTQQLNIRLLDQAGNWSKTATTTYSVTRGNVIYRNNFEPADPAWTPVTGSGTTVSTAAKLPTSWEPGSTRGLQVVVPTGSNTGVKPNYVTNTSPTAETAYHARFVFNPNSLTAGTQSGTALTLFQAFSGNNTNTQTFALRFTRVGQGTSQVSVILNRNGGTTTSTPLTLTNGAANQIQLDWTSGTNGSVKLTVGASSVTVSGNTGNLRVDTVRLGVISGFTASSAGTAYFDSFSSGRVTAV